MAETIMPAAACQVTRFVNKTTGMRPCIPDMNSSGCGRRYKRDGSGSQVTLQLLTFRPNLFTRRMPADPHVVHRAPDQGPPITIYAKWRATDTLPRKDRSHPIAKNTVAHLYDVPICPDEPLRVGLYVKLRALSPQAYRPPYLPMETPRFDTYDPHIEGSIVGVSLVQEHTAEFVVRNECWWNPVAYAYIAVQYLPGLTAKLQLWEADCHWLLHTRLRSTCAAPLLSDAEITSFPGEDIGHYPAQFEYPDPVSDATPWLHVWSLERSRTRSTASVLRPATWSS